MIFFKRRKYPLPKVPATLESSFRSLCEPLGEEALLRISSDFDKGVKELHVALQDNPHISTQQIDRAAQACRYLLSVYKRHSSEEQALIVGALRYFLATQDALPATTFASGLDDDIAVINHVLEELGVEGQFVLK